MGRGGVFSYGRSPVCLRMWAVKWVDWLDAYAHPFQVQWNGFSPVCMSATRVD